MTNSFENQYKIRTLTEDDSEDCWQILGDDFNKNEPVLAELKISIDCSQMISLRSWKIKQYLNQHAGIGAYEKSSNKIVGCAILCLSHKISEEKCPVNIDEASLNFRQRREYLSFCFDGVTEIIGEVDYTKIAYLACVENHRRRGVATNLFMHAVDVARQEACKKVLIRTSNYFVQRIATKNHFDCCKEVYFSEYVDAITGTKVLCGIPEPHQKCAIFMKDL